MMKEKEQGIRKRNKHTVYVRCFSGFNVSFDIFCDIWAHPHHTQPCQIPIQA